ncbi:MAG: trypsin-like peptidase domain-containing protein [Gemmatimonadaceae bacterium]|nr:trypsin-like peptidase domain-containing protein [Gemmatimonadaceae bacterium]
MKPSIVYIRRAAFMAAAFIGGLVVASRLDWTPLAHAQARSVANVVSGNTPVIGGAPADFTAVAARVTPAVVSIRAEHDARPVAARRQRSPQGKRQQQLPPGLPEEFQRFFDFQMPDGPGGGFSTPDQGPQVATGSGFIVSPDGYVLTNNHVIEGADRVTVGLPDRREFKAKVIGRDPQTDVAVLKIDGKNLPTIPLGDDTQSKVGEWVIAVGNPLQLDFTVTAGIISAKGRENELRSLNNDKYAIQDFIQTDAAINPGNSGGPLVDTHGNVIGINSAISSPTGTYAGYGFAIPITLAKTVMDDLIAHGHVRRAILGAMISDVTQEDAEVAKLGKIAGIKVQDFSPADNSPAKRAGIERGDIIIAADGKPVDRVADLQRLIRTKEPGDDLALETVRYGTHEHVTVKLGEAKDTSNAVAAADDGSDSGDAGAAPAAVASAALGVTLQPLTADVASQQGIQGISHGLLVTSVKRGGVAEGSLIPGDVITNVIFPRPGVATNSMAELNGALGKAKGGYVGLQVSRQSDDQGNRTTAVVNLKLAN